MDVAGVLDQSVRAVAQGGEVTLVGASQGKEANAEPLSAATIFRSGATIRPMAVGSRRQFLELNRAVESSTMRPLIDASSASTTCPRPSSTTAPATRSAG
ncbi:hypothetical protein [Kribbella sp. NPDC051620]|uniref:hypothetical protein n=1 Tax=Kribbella sp. NPDC051620 TaxID=3364120 RepID=UPI0037958739